MDKFGALLYSDVALENISIALSFECSYLFNQLDLLISF